MTLLVASGGCTRRWPLAISATPMATSCTSTLRRGCCMPRRVRSSTRLYVLPTRHVTPCSSSLLTAPWRHTFRTPYAHPRLRPFVPPVVTPLTMCMYYGRRYRLSSTCLAPRWPGRQSCLISVTGPARPAWRPSHQARMSLTREHRRSLSSPAIGFMACARQLRQSRRSRVAAVRSHQPAVDRLRTAC